MMCVARLPLAEADVSEPRAANYKGCDEEKDEDEDKNVEQHCGNHLDCFPFLCFVNERVSAVVLRRKVGLCPFPASCPRCFLVFGGRSGGWVGRWAARVKKGNKNGSRVYGGNTQLAAKQVK